ncbi:MAG TPA: DUF6624 domain-containing protein [Gemmatimonadaceae bacterium]|nr:DUF6624 domain-containing protein [Gemmatimonadaceae bacterium]
MAFACLPAGARAQSSCPDVDSTAAWARVLRAWQDETGDAWTNDSLRQVLLRLGQRDQAVRADYGTRVGDTAFTRELLRQDSILSDSLSRILDRFGLPTRAMVGSRGADAAMRIAQHSATLQPRVFALAQALPPASISPEALALLEDRVLVGQGRPQRFGSQFTAGSDGVFRFAPVDDPGGLEQRRAAAGLPPLALYVCMVEQSGIRIDRSTLPRPP